MIAIKPRGGKHATLQIADYFVPPNKRPPSVRATIRDSRANAKATSDRRIYSFGRKVCELARGKHSRDRITSSVQIHYATMLPAVTKRDNPASQKITDVNNTKARAQKAHMKARARVIDFSDAEQIARRDKWREDAEDGRSDQNLVRRSSENNPRGGKTAKIKSQTRDTTRSHKVVTRYRPLMVSILIIFRLRLTRKKSCLLAALSVRPVHGSSYNISLRLSFM